jgi:hemin uptake protein HemP
MSISSPLNTTVQADLDLIVDNYCSSVGKKKLMAIDSVEEQMLPTLKKLPTYGAKSLTKGLDQAQIILGDQIYTLRITRAGKLLLTK